MSWVTIIWSMTASACLTLAAIYFLVWCQWRTAWTNLLFTLASVSVAAYVFCELSMFQAETPAQFATALRWAYVPAFVFILSLVGFIRLHLRAGRPWLGWTICALWTSAVLLNFLTGQNLSYREILHLRHIMFLGESLSIAVGVSNPLMLFGQVGLLLFVIFTADATLAAWRRGDQRQALVTGGSILFCGMMSTLQSVLVLWQLVDWPLMASPFALGIIVAMGYELSHETLRAAQLSDDLRESRQRLDLAAHAAKLGLWAWDIARDEIWATDNGRQLFGFGQSERINFNRFLNSLHPDDREPVSHAVANSFNHGGDYRSEHRVVIPGQPMRWIAARGSVEFNKAGKPIFMRGISLDVTERKRNEEALRESEARFRTVANTAPVLIWMSGTDKLCNFFNQGWLDFTGRTLEQESGNGWAKGVHPDDLARCLKIYVEAFDARQPFTMEYRLRRRDGEYRWISDHGVPRYDSDGGFLGYIGSCADLTERKLADERFRLTVEASPNGVVLVDGAGHIVLVNAQTERLFGYPREELIGQTIEILLPERFRGGHPGHRTGFFAAPQTRAMGAGRELFALRKDGTEFPVEIGLSPIQTMEGVLVLTAIADITTRKQAEAEAVRQRAELAHVARVSTMGELAASVAHELNQPLGAILANAEAADLFLNQDPPALDELRAILADIRKDDQRASEVIRRMRNLLRKRELERKALEMNSVVEDVLQVVSGDIALRKMAISADLAPSLPEILGDRVHLQQVLLNLILNGMDAMADQPRERRRLTVRTRASPASSVELAVVDLGHGIEPDKLARLFEPFYTTKPNGMGMGLSISRTIIEAHRGRIWAENNASGGLTFHVTLPIAAVPTKP